MKNLLNSFKPNFRKINFTIFFTFLLFLFPLVSFLIDLTLTTEKGGIIFGVFLLIIGLIVRIPSFFILLPGFMLYFILYYILFYVFNLRIENYMSLFIVSLSILSWIVIIYGVLSLKDYYKSDRKEKN